MKWSGKIAYRSGDPVEVEPGIYEHKTVERKATGDIESYRTSHQNDGQSVNDNLRIDNVVSVVASRKTHEWMHEIIYVTHMGVKWKAQSVGISGNRLRITLGEVYHDRPED